LSIRDLTFMGNPILLKPAQAVDDVSDPALQELMDDMVETMSEAGGVGIAAPQVDQSRRLIVALPMRNREQDPEVPPLILVNPVLEPLGEDMVEGLEGCLSIPGLRGIVPRYRRVRWEAQDRHGQPIGGIAEDFFARILQHEVDHLDGILFLQRMNDLTRLAMQSEVHYLMPKDDVPCPPDEETRDDQDERE
jgi:peptide deformylase